MPSPVNLFAASALLTRHRDIRPLATVILGRFWRPHKTSLPPPLAIILRSLANQFTDNLVSLSLLFYGAWHLWLARALRPGAVCQRRPRSPDAAPGKGRFAAAVQNVAGACVRRCGCLLLFHFFFSLFLERVCLCVIPFSPSLLASPWQRSGGRSGGSAVPGKLCIGVGVSMDRWVGGWMGGGASQRVGSN